MKRGRKPQSPVVKAQKAAVRSRRSAAKLAEGESSSPVMASAIAPPAWLKNEGLRIWKRLSPGLVAAKLLYSADVHTFARYCRNFARWLKMQKELDADGETYESDSQHGKLRRVSPAFMVADRIERQLLAAEDRFGLNPAERQRIYAERSQKGITPDLFTPAPAQPGQRRPDDPATKPLAPAEPLDEPIGLLN